MKSFLGIAFIFALGTQVALGGSIGGIGGVPYRTIHFYATTQVLIIPGHPGVRFEVIRKGATSDSNLKTYYLDPAEFAYLLDLSDSRQVIFVQGENGTGSYRVISGEQAEQVELIDRRAAIRSEVRE